MHQESGNRTIEIFWDVKNTPSDLLKQCRHMLIIKWEGATKKSIQNNTTAPDINFRTCIQPREDDNTKLKCKCHFLTACTLLLLCVPIYTVQTPNVLLSKLCNEIYGHSPTLNGCSPERTTGLTHCYSNFPRENSTYVYLTQTKLNLLIKKYKIFYGWFLIETSK